MNIKILDSWLRDYLKTDAKPKDIAEMLSLTSASVERLEEWKDDLLYDIEITTNRPDMASVVGIAREAGAVLPQSGIDATFAPPVLEKPKGTNDVSITIENDPKLVNRICAVVMEVTVKPTPEKIKNRLESTDIRSLNNVIDITNYVMRTLGYPTHVMDFDRLNTKKLTIRESKKGETITTLDKKEYMLPGDDIVAVDDAGRIVDLLGIMGLENSVVTDQTKRILFFINNDNQHKIRKTSMTLGIRTEAAQLNEKNLDPELAYDALLYGMQLFQELADGKVISELIDIYPNKPESKSIMLSEEKINKVIGVDIPLSRSEEILKALGFQTTLTGTSLTATVPSWRVHEVSLPEDLIEEIARVYGYHNLPNVLPPVTIAEYQPLAANPFYWEQRTKDAFKYWGYTEVYTYSMVSETMYEGPTENAVTLANPLTEEGIYMRSTLIPSLLQVVRENRNRDTVRIFEIANVYRKNGTDLPVETRILAGLLKKPNASFYEVKGLLEQLLSDLGIKNPSFRPLAKGGTGADVFIGTEKLGEIEVLDENLVDFELNFEPILKHANLKKTYTPLAKYPPVIEDLALIVPDNIQTAEVIDMIKKQSPLITDVSLLDKYKETRTFHIIYLDREKNLTGEEVGKIREKILKVLQKSYDVKPK